ncbi:hypothetical protein P152DRAFT_398773 [Eremomyces bilateralis CBS 781.70]|uniref:Uncharacterized protein n=1 Tax=Eremomyces bilateralis CBS 781.70 TaxID=1392243 RepID=A0A6G1G1N5_9PEZI|nr:uncharacterized protein P152DRAFT_398773 [Eremomyces bilateralis CBS 781.70]KAF1811719.1 hypothetical protein P152DRAFT_398773 [Eremomyces bilateralis CBS 781.70]
MPLGEPTTGGTGFVNRIDPPIAIKGYNPAKTYDHQPDTVDPVFLEAMSVREDVFVQGQGVPQAEEVDADDPISYHWVCYASVSRKKSATDSAAVTDAPESSAADEVPRNALGGKIIMRRRSSAYQPEHLGKRPPSPHTTVPVGTVRFVPPIRNRPREVPGTPTSFPTKEPFVKVTRLAVHRQFRGLGLTRLLLSDAFEFIVNNPEKIVPPLGPAEREAYNAQGKSEELWKGLLLVHAQKPVKGLWERYGFKQDEGMGEWMEDGCLHIGMWRWLEPKFTWIIGPRYN